MPKRETVTLQNTHRNNNKYIYIVTRIKKIKIITFKIIVLQHGAVRKYMTSLKQNSSCIKRKKIIIIIMRIKTI